MSRFASRCRAALCAATVLVLGMYASTASAQTAPDFSTPGSAFNVLPPGNAGAIPVVTNSSDQIPLYDGITPKFDNVTAADSRTSTSRMCSASAACPSRARRRSPTGPDSW